MNVPIRQLTLHGAAGLFVLAACGVLLLGPVAAEEPPRAENPGIPGAGELQTFALKYTPAEEMVRLLKAVFSDKDPSFRITALGRTNSILVHGSAAQLAEVKALLAKVDTEAADPATVLQPPRIIPLGSVEPDKGLVEALQMVFTRGTAGNFSVDPQRRLVIISADDATLRTAQRLLIELEDQNARRSLADVQLRFLWLVSGLNREDGPPLPDDLKEVLPGLARLGINRPQLAAQSVVSVTPNAEFQVKGTAQLDAPCQFSVTGRLRTDRLSDPKAAPGLEVTLRAMRPKQGGTEEICSLQTQIGAPAGHLVVLGVTPTGTMTSVFVIQLVPQAVRVPGPKK